MKTMIALNLKFFFCVTNDTKRKMNNEITHCSSDNERMKAQIDLMILPMNGHQFIMKKLLLKSIQ